MSQLNVVLTAKRNRDWPRYPTEVAPVIYDLTRKVFAVKFSTSLPGGFMQATLSVLMRRAEAQEWYERHLFSGIDIYEAEQPIWEGRITGIAVRDHGIDLTCEGYWASLADVRIHGMWSENDMSKWRVPAGWRDGMGTIESETTMANANDKFLIDTYDYLFSIALRGAQSYLIFDRGILFYRLPRFDLLTTDSIFQPQTIHSMMYSYDFTNNFPMFNDLMVWTAPSAQGTWTMREWIKNFGESGAGSGPIISGTRLLPLVEDGTDVRAVAFGIEMNNPWTTTGEDRKHQIMFTNVMLWADNWPLTERRSTNKKVITDLLCGNAGIDLDEKAVQLSNDVTHIDESDADFAPLAFEDDTLQDIVAKLGEVGIVESKGFQFKQGGYTGDGTTGRAITGIGFQPKVVVIKAYGGTSSEAGIRTATMSAGIAIIDTGLEATIDSLDSDGFTVSYDAGDTAGTNEDGITYFWYCFGGSRVECSTYIGNLQHGTHIPLGFPERPSMVWIVPSTLSPVRWAITGGTPGYTMQLGGGASHVVDEILELLPGEFVISSNSAINYIAETYHYVAFAPTPALITGLYVGSGYDLFNQPTEPIHFLADLLNIKRVDAGTTPCVWGTKDADPLGGIFLYEQGSPGAVVKNIREGLGQWKVYAHEYVNQLDAVYYFFAFAEGTYPDVYDMKYIPATVGVFGRRKLHFKKRDRANIKWVASVAALGEDGLQLERSIGAYWTKMWASYVEPITQFNGWTEASSSEDARLRGWFWHTERFTTIGTGSVPETTAEAVRDMRIADAAKPTQRTQLTLTGFITNVVGAQEPLWRVRAGDLLFLQDLSILPQLRPDAATGLPDSLRVFTIKETEYDVEGRSLSITLDYAPEVLDLFLARTELTLAPYALGSTIISGTLVSTLQGGWQRWW